MKNPDKMSNRELVAEVRALRKQEFRFRCALDALRKDKDAPLYVRSFAGSYLGLHFEDDESCHRQREERLQDDEN